MRMVPTSQPASRRAHRGHAHWPLAAVGLLLLVASAVMMVAGR
jgi:hypothetical protein